LGRKGTIKKTIYYLCFMPLKNPPDWPQRIYDLVRKIPPGRVSTYGILADKVGIRATSRMVGWAMNASHNQQPPVPAHRVVNRNGVLTGRHHFATPTLMQELLEAEGIPIEDHQISNFNQVLYTF
jgi:methylated-DNA-protein-cysteine methyltransferase-like protein